MKTISIGLPHSSDIEVAVSLTLTCGCGCGMVAVYDFPPEYSNVGGLSIWTSPDIEVAVGLLMGVFEPQLLKKLSKENDDE